MHFMVYKFYPLKNIEDMRTVWILCNEFGRKKGSAESNLKVI